MSRSYIKTSFSRNAMTHSRASEKKDKKIYHKRFRRCARFNIEYIPNKNEIYNKCKFSKDGKRYIINRSEIRIYK